VPASWPPASRLRTRAALAVAIGTGPLGVLASHGFPTVAHPGLDHGLEVGDLAAVCLAVTAFTVLRL
jgi:hypothetical protein